LRSVLCVQISSADVVGVPPDVGQHGHYPSQLTRIRSVDAAVEEGHESVEDTERLKSSRVMDWVRGELNSTSNPPEAEASSPLLASPLEYALSEPTEMPEKR
jgi:hypothetical protein